MKALVQNGYGSVDVLEYRDVEKPVPTRNEVLVKIVTTAVNDWEWGILTMPVAVRLFLGLRRPRGRFSIMGCDMAGRVESVGSDVTKFESGDEVYCDLSGYRFGGFAEHVCVAEKCLVRKPESMSFEQAAALPHAADLALEGIRKAGELKAGQQVLVNGAGGGVGTLAIQMLKEFDVEITAVDKLEKHAQLRSLGCEHVIEYPKVNFTRTGKQYDFILDTRTNESVFDYLRALKPHGIYATVGGERVFRFMFTSLFVNPFVGNRLKMVGQKPNKNLDQINRLFESGMRPVIDGVFEFTGIRDALTRFRRAEHQGKIIIRVEEK